MERDLQGLEKVLKLVDGNQHWRLHRVICIMQTKTQKTLEMMKLRRAKS